ncbi:hypothetical protein F0562_003019 [Nyssa sinensis]|uniref:Retrotransposon Copia-like N-terminal domain-containing protein n=1 Tax=Nyssa sinensis TaxID=561372 RepID=A0A5J5BXA7_9ASTE|nr:hypothetical protein F0562_003019 [Nyssa sinensis]
MASSLPTASAAFVSIPPTSLTTHPFISIKLSRDNYLLWRAQIVPYLKGTHLFGYVDGTLPAPPTHISSTENNQAHSLPNPAFHSWHLQDQLILSALISSLTEIFLSHVVKCTTSRDVWLALERLGPDYDSFVTSVTTRVEPLSLEDLYGHLLAHEKRLEQHQAAVDLTVANANFTSRNTMNRGGRGNCRGSPSHNGRGHYQNSPPRNYRNRGRGRSSPSSSNNSCPVCQVCNKTGHVALDCYYMYDESYQRDSS